MKESPMDQIESDNLPVRISSKTLEEMRNRRNNNGADFNSMDNPASVFSVRYGFRPDSLDQNASFEMLQDKDEYVIEAPVTNNADPLVFRGSNTEAKANDFVLAYDPNTESFELLPMDSIMRVSRSREKPKSRQQGLTMPSALPQQPQPQQPQQPQQSATTTISSSSSSSQRQASKSTSPIPQSRSMSPIDDRNYTSSKSKVGSKTVPKSSTPPVAPAPAPAPVVPQTASPKKKEKKAPKRKKVSGKKPPASSSAVKNAEQPAEDDVDEDLMGALANELEESLEDDDEPMGQAPPQQQQQQQQQAVDEESEESDEDDDGNVMVLEPRSQPQRPSFSTNTSSGPSGGPISLRGYVSGNRPDEDELSSSEEE